MSSSRRDPVHEAIRGRRAVRQGVGHERVAAQPWLASAADFVTMQPAGGLLRRCIDGHQGVCADAEDFRYADADRLLAGGDACAADRPGPGSQDPQNLRAISRAAECAGAAGLVLPEARSAEVTPAVWAPAGAISSACRSRWSATSPTS